MQTKKNNDNNGICCLQTVCRRGEIIVKKSGLSPLIIQQGDFILLIF